MKPMRLDQWLAQSLESRSKAQDAIADGRVLVNGKTIKKPACKIQESDVVQVLPAKEEFVSRAGFKLKGAIDRWNIDLQGKIVLDIGASTGGFTDVCLQSGAEKVYALDVGHLQLNRRLAEDPRVIKMEGMNARYLKKDWLQEEPDFLCVDVSFISAKTILEPVLQELVCPELVLLVKPQFECGPAALNQKGVLKNEKLRTQILEEMKTFLLQYYKEADVMDSVLAGRSGNREALIYARNRREMLHD